MSNEAHLRVMRFIAANPKINQRQLAIALGISLGKANYCLQTLIKHGWVKVSNFRGRGNKLSYAYLLTPQGVEEKARLTLQFLQYKREEFEILKEEIDVLSEEVKSAAE